MNANRIAYTALIAFIAVIATLLLVHLFQNNEAPQVNENGETVYTLQDVAEHDSADSCWKVIEGVVYDFTDYFPEHPSDEDVFLRWCGRDATHAWYDKGGVNRPHSPRAQAMLEDYRIGVTPGSATPAPDVSATSEQQRPDDTGDMPGAMQRQWGQALLALAPGNYLDGIYRGNFIDRGHIQISLQFRLEEGRIHDVEYRYLGYRDVDYLALDEDAELYPVVEQHRQIQRELEGEPLAAIFRLHQPGEVVDDIDGYSGATLRGAKILHAIRDGLNRGVYIW